MNVVEKVEQLIEKAQDADAKDIKGLFLNTLTEININEEFELNTKRLFCTSLTRFSTPNAKGTLSGYFFYKCGGVEYIDIGKIAKVDPLSVNGVHSIQTIILRSTETVASLTGAFSNVNSITNPNNTTQCYFYVPKALIEDYKVATNWSNYDYRFRAIEDYPEITGGVI